MWIITSAGAYIVTPAKPYVVAGQSVHVSTPDPEAAQALTDGLELVGAPVTPAQDPEAAHALRTTVDGLSAWFAQEVSQYLAPDGLVAAGLVDRGVEYAAVLSEIRENISGLA